MSTLLNGNANLSADMAIRFEKAFGIKADTLLRMQTTYELAQAREHEQDIKVEKFCKSCLTLPTLRPFTAPSRFVETGPKFCVWQTKATCE